MNLHDVAKRAKVSTATVSRVLNGTGAVRATTRDRVLAAAEALRYYPNLNARSLAGGRSRTLGMIVSNIENPFFLDIYRSIEDDALRRGYDVLVANTAYRRERLVASVRLMLGRRVAGLALVVSEMDASLLRELEELAIPVVCYDVRAPRRSATQIRVDYAAGMRKIVEYLYALGHRRMAFVGHHTTLGPLHARQRAFLDVTAALAPRVRVTTVANADGLHGGQAAARELLGSGFRPTAIACVNDVMAVGVLRELRARQIDVPRDVSVTGFDNIALAEFVAPPLTTAHIPRERIGHLICEALVERGSDASRARDTVLEPELIVRDTTASVHTKAKRAR